MTSQTFLPRVGSHVSRPASRSSRISRRACGAALSVAVALLHAGCSASRRPSEASVDPTLEDAASSGRADAAVESGSDGASPPQGGPLDDDAGMGDGGHELGGDDGGVQALGPPWLAFVIGFTLIWWRMSGSDEVLLRNLITR